MLKPAQRRSFMRRFKIRKWLYAARPWALKAGYYSGLLRARRVLGSGKVPGLLVLMYHSIGSSDLLRPHLAVSEKNFAGQLEHLRRHFKIVSLESAVGMLQREEPLPENAAALTFDDGFRDNYEAAFPLLRKLGLPATIFVSTAPLLDRTTLWPYKLIFWLWNSGPDRLEFGRGEWHPTNPAVFDMGTRRRRRRAVYLMEAELQCVAPAERERRLVLIAKKLGFEHADDPFDSFPMLAPDELREMAGAGVEIGSHTVTHPALPALDSTAALDELTRSKTVLESALGRPVRFFAYPFGKEEHFNPEIETLVRRAGYQAACTAIRGVNLRGTDPFRLLRLGVKDDPPEIFAYKLSRWFASGPARRR